MNSTQLTIDIQNKITTIENEVIVVEKAVDEIIEISLPQYEQPVEYCFGLCNVVLDLLLKWWYMPKQKNP